MRSITRAALCFVAAFLPASAAGKDAAAPPPYPLACHTFEDDLDRHENCARREGAYFRIAPERIARLYFHDGLGQVAIDEIGWLWMRRDGLALPVFLLDNGPDPFEQGLVRGWRAGKVVFFDRDLAPVLVTPYDWAFPFNGKGEALVCEGCRSDNRTPYASMIGGKWAVIDRKGRIVLPLSKTPAARDRYFAAF